MLGMVYVTAPGALFEGGLAGEPPFALLGRGFAPIPRSDSNRQTKESASQRYTPRDFSRLRARRPANPEESHLLRSGSHVVSETPGFRGHSRARVSRSRSKVLADGDEPRVLRVAVYVRVSTEEQGTEGFSIEVQEARCRSFCDAQGWDVSKVYVDPGNTGLDTDRPGYKRALAEMKKWDVMLAVKGDRFHRSVDNAREWLHNMRAGRKMVWSIAEGRLDKSRNAAQWLATGLITQMLPEMEARQISERVIPAMEMAKSKDYHVGRPPVGFRWVKHDKVFEPTDWGKKVRADAEAHGLAEAGKRHVWQKPSKLAGKHLSKSTVWRVLRNFKRYEAGELKPNREETETGAHSKFKGELGYDEDLL